jgi:hypothetical protein
MITTATPRPRLNEPRGKKMTIRHDYETITAYDFCRSDHPAAEHYRHLWETTDEAVDAMLDVMDMSVLKFPGDDRSNWKSSGYVAKPMGMTFFVLLPCPRSTPTST